jgi:hypothetical protein
MTVFGVQCGSMNPRKTQWYAVGCTDFSMACSLARMTDGRRIAGGWSMTHPVNQHLLPGKDDEYWDWSTAGK